jgi:hypothetical protein
VRSTLLAVAAVALALPIVARAAPNTAQPTQSRHVTGHAIAADLKRSGFTNIRVRPVAFVARATDSKGRMVLMAFRPNSFTAVTQLRSTGPASNSGTNNATNGTDNQSNNHNNNQNNESNTTK